MTRSGITVLLAALLLQAPATRAAPLDKEGCANLKAEQGQLENAGTRAAPVPLPRPAIGQPPQGPDRPRPGGARARHGCCQVRTGRKGAQGAEEGGRKKGPRQAGARKEEGGSAADQSRRQQRWRATPTASIADFPGRYP